MKSFFSKKNLLTVIAAFFIGLLFAGLSTVIAETASPSANQNAEGQQQAKAWVCLKAESTAGHVATISVSDDPNQRPLANKETYIVVCLNTAEGNVCTTGNSQTDLKLLGADYYSQLQAKYNYKLEEFQKVGTAQGATMRLVPQVFADTQITPTFDPNPTQSTADRTVGPYLWGDSLVPSVTHEWFAVNYYDPQQLECGTGAGQQQCTFTFEGLAGKCAGIAWDPYGRIFDSQSLEPITGTSLNIQLKRADGTFSPLTAFDPEAKGGVKNPSAPTLADGRFSFLVGAGIYKLDVVDNPNFTFAQSPTLNPNFSKIYSDIYKKGAEIDERFGAQHRDIPLVSKGLPYHSDVTIMERSDTLDKVNGILVFKWRFSHPFTQVAIYAQKADPTDKTGTKFLRTKTLFNGKADKDGWFNAEVNQLLLSTGETVGIDYQKVSLVGPLPHSGLFDKFVGAVKSLMLGEVQAQTVETKTLTVEPIPNYLEGYAQDPNGNVLPNAKVGVYLTNATRPYYETQADDKGYFKITSEYLPFMPYKLKYSTANGTVINLPASRFVTQNAQYITAQKVNVYDYKNVQGVKPVALAKKTNTTGTGGTANQPSSGNQTGTSPAGTASSPFLVTLIILLILIGVLGLMLGVYLLKKNQQSPPLG